MSVNIGALLSLFPDRSHTPQRGYGTGHTIRGPCPYDSIMSILPEAFSPELVAAIQCVRSHERWGPVFGGNLSAYSGDHSRADLALCGEFARLGLAPNAIDTALRASALYREKWEREDYRSKTIATAVGGIAANERDHSTPEVASQNGGALPNRLLTAEEVKERPSLPYRVRGLLPALGVGAIYGASGSGKSFLAMDLCFAIAAGSPDWFGMATRQAPVVYIALEGRGGISKRLKAWEAHYKVRVSTQVRFWLDGFTLLHEHDAQMLASQVLEAVGPGGVVVVDTLNQSAPGADENSSVDMSALIRNAQGLAELIQGLVLLIHHSGKDKARGMRGHSSLIAAMDAAIEVTASASGRSFAVFKAKDDEDGLSYDFELAPYVVGADDDGEDVTSCAVRRTLNLAVVKAKPVSGKHQTAAMNRLRQVLATSSVGISHDAAIQEVAAVLICPSPRKATVAKATVDKLLMSGHLHLNHGLIEIA